MTTEQKAKRYDEAISQLKGLLDGIHEEKCDIIEEDIVRIFPELAESEDERVRKALKEGFKYHKLFNQTFGGIPCIEIENWLEKLSEKKSSDEVLKIRQEESGMTLEEKIKIELHDYLYKSGLSQIICTNDRLKVAKHFTEWANKTMIDKACEWIERNQKTDIDIDDFRQAMEE